MLTDGPPLREMRTSDVDDVMAVQEPASIAGLSGVFPQDTHPFPRDVLAQRWRDEIADDEVDCFVILRDGAVAGFAATCGGEVKHFGVAVEEWGSGLAIAAHDQLVALVRAAGHATPWLRAYAANPRGRAFYEKLGWTDTGERSRGPMPPHAELMTYELRPENVRNRS
ncbi:GNAT superfamily N-acetyltransferase [Nocardioides sp. BE266]|uniref:GNAT family N-acetyltransferase n=1 Tax=Nocardioides sp. BE266 TaxID=2817725 RepID=UPI00285666B2|nr:GNAT family N-acetyltransferase [Nocardioides sp. BE266]MDR7251461.1 GNAT superfamily N-acetyltransferase [Nocardioides sp. BE266]